MPRRARIAALGALAMVAGGAGTRGLAFTGRAGVGVDWSTTSVFYTGATSGEASTVPEAAEATATAGQPSSRRAAPSKWIGAASLAALGPVVAKMMTGRQPPFRPEVHMVSEEATPIEDEVPKASPLPGVPDAGAEQSLGERGQSGLAARAGLPTAMLITACAALGLRAARRRGAAGLGSRGAAAAAAPAVQVRAQRAKSEGAILGRSPAAAAAALQPLAKQSTASGAEGLPYPTKFFRIMTDSKQDIQKPAEFFRIMTEADAPSGGPKEFARSVTEPLITDVEPARKQSPPPGTIEEGEEEAQTPRGKLTRRITEPLPEEFSKPENNDWVADLGQMGYVREVRQRIEQRGPPLRAR